MASEDYEALKALQADRQQQGRERRIQACADFDDAVALGNNIGVQLFRFSKVHFRVSITGASWDIYPGNQRIIGLQRSLFLKLPSPWALLDVVKAAAEFLGKKYLED